MKAVTIIGGGLAGLALGISLRRASVPVTIREAGRYPRHRVCGEFITGVRPETLEDLGIRDLLEDALRLRSLTWFNGTDPILQKQLPRGALGISRWALDEALARRFMDLSGELQTGSREARRPASTPGIVWAAGRQPAVRRTGQRWIGLKVHLEGISLASDLELHMGTGGYAGISRIEGGRLNLCGLFRQARGLEGRGLELLERYLERNGLERLAGLLKKATVHADSFCAVSGLDYGLSFFPQRGFAIGDNWSLIPPFTGNGMSMAFESALLARNVLLKWSGDQRSWPAAVRDYQTSAGEAFHARIRRARLLHGFLLSPGSRLILTWLARRGALPFHTLYAFTH